MPNFVGLIIIIENYSMNKIIFISLLLISFISLNGQHQFKTGGGLNFATGVNVDYDEHDKLNPGFGLNLWACYEPTDNFGFEAGIIKYLPTTPPTTSLSLYAYYLDLHFTLFHNRIDKIYAIAGFYNSHYTFKDSDFAYDDYERSYPGVNLGVGASKSITTKLDAIAKAKLAISGRTQFILQAGISYTIN